MSNLKELVVVLLESLEERNVSATEEMVEDFLNDYIDSGLIEVEDVVVSESILDELSEYVETFELVSREDDDEDCEFEFESDFEDDESEFDEDEVDESAE